MFKDRTRPFIKAPFFCGAPMNHYKEYFVARLKEYRKQNPIFDSFLKEIEKIIVKDGSGVYKNILMFLKGEPEPNYVSPNKSVFRLFIKLYNYDFSPQQAFNYIESCYFLYFKMLNTRYKLSNRYEVFSQRTRWDGSTRDFLKISLEKTDKIHYDSEIYSLELTFCSLQETNQELGFASDTSLKIISHEDKYEDALILFDYYQGEKYLKGVLSRAVSDLLDKGIIVGPTKVIYSFDDLDFYKINWPREYLTNSKNQ